MGMLLTCEETVAALSHYVDGVLPLNPFLKVRLHLFNCPGCRSLLNTLRALPELAAGALAEEKGMQKLAQPALVAALARLRQPGAARPRAASPIPREVQPLLEGNPDLAMRLLACVHDLIARERVPPGPIPLPQGILDRLPAQEHWRWEDDRNGGRKVDLLADPLAGLRLLLVYAPPGSALPPHRHLGSESILILDGSMDDQGRDCVRGDWTHHPPGSCHGPRVAACGCWFLVREEGMVRFLGPAGWLRNLGHAS